VKIFTKTFLYTLVILVLIALTAHGIIYILMPKAYTRQKEDELTRYTNQLVEQLENSKQEDIRKLMSQYADSLQANLQIQIGEDAYSMVTWNQGIMMEDLGSATDKKAGDQANIYVKVVGGEKDQESEDESASGSYTFTGLLSDEAASESKTLQISRNFIMEGQSGKLESRVTLAPVDEAVDVIISLVPISLLICLVMAVLFSLFYAGVITRPIKAISSETQKMTDLDGDAKCYVDTKDEIGMLAGNVNDLYQNLLNTIHSLELELNKVSTAERTKTEFLQAASHELKTPVTALSLMLENMILKIGKYKDYDHWLVKCKEQVDCLSEMLHELLMASQLEESAEEAETISIEVLSKSILEPYLLIARAKGLVLDLDWSQDFMITCPIKKLEKALSNVFFNAVKYTPPGGNISIYCNSGNLYIENECRPIPDDQLSRIYEPFYRPDVSRSRDTGGNGLGLFITDKILRKLDIDYSFKPMADKGMRFILFF